MPLVSIIMTSFNYAAYISVAIESVLKQTYTNWELLIIDDGSQDNSIEIITSFLKKHPQKIFLYTHENFVNKGIKASIELGIQNSKGTYIAFCESDDLFLNHNLEHKIALLEKHSDCVLAYSNLILLGSKKNSSIHYYSKGIHFFGKHHFKYGNYFDFGIFKFNPIGTFSNIVVRKESLKNLKLNQEYEAWSDLQLLTHLSLRGKFYYINQALIQWRIHSNSTNQQLKNKTSFKKNYTVLFDTTYKKLLKNSSMFSLKIFILKASFVLLHPFFLLKKAFAIK